MKLDTSLAIIFGSVTVLQVLGALVKVMMRFFRQRRRVQDTETSTIHDLDTPPDSTTSRMTPPQHSTGIELDVIAPTQHLAYLDWPVLPSPYDESSREQREWGAL